MSWANPLLEHGAFLVAGASAFLALGSLINLLQKAPIQRIRVTELAVGCALVFALLSVAPLPRPLAAAPAANETAPITRPPAYDFGPVLGLIENTRAELAGRPPLAEQPLAPAPLAEVPLAESSSAASVPVLDAVPLLLPAAADPVEAAPAAPLPIRESLLGLWLLGAALSAGWLLLGAWRVHRVLRRSRPASRPVHQLLREHGIELPRRVRLRIAQDEVRPFCVGLFRPTIVIPAQLLETEGRVSLAPVIHHELAHATQRDARGLWLLALAQIPFWFHPLFWWLRAQHRFATELVADAIAAGNTSNRAYARELVHLVERQSTTPTAVVGATALFRQRSDFYQRMQMLLTRRQPLATRTTLRRRALHSLFGLALLTGASSLGGAAPLPAQQEPAEIQRQADEIARLRAENSQLRADLAEMQVVLTDLRDLLTQLRADQEAERMDRKDGMLQKLVEDDQHEALRALGYLAVEEYVVREGDSLAKIVGKDAASDSEYLKTLQELNPNLLTSIRGGYRINLVPGQSLMLPRQKHSADPANPFQEAVEYTALIYVVQEGETVFDIALKHGLMSRDLQLLFYGLNADKFGSKVPDEMHAYQLKRGDTLRVPVANGDGEVVAQTTPEGLLKLNFSYRDVTGKIHGQDGPVDPATQRIYWGRLMEDGQLAGRVLDAQGREVADAYIQLQNGELGSGSEEVPILSDLPLLQDLFQDEAAASGAPLPAVNLAECMEIAFRSIDMQGELTTAKEKLMQSEQLAKKSMISATEFRAEETRVRTLQRKYELAQRVVQARISDLEHQIDELASRYKKDHPAFPHREIQARKQAIEVLAEGLR